MSDVQQQIAQVEAARVRFVQLARLEALEDAKEVILARIRRWLDESRQMPADDQVGYPPYHLMEAVRDIDALKAKPASGEKLVEVKP